MAAGHLTSRNLLYNTDLAEVVLVRARLLRGRLLVQEARAEKVLYEGLEGARILFEAHHTRAKVRVRGAREVEKMAPVLPDGNNAAVRVDEVGAELIQPLR